MLKQHGSTLLESDNTHTHTLTHTRTEKTAMLQKNNIKPGFQPSHSGEPPVMRTRPWETVYSNSKRQIQKHAEPLSKSVSPDPSKFRRRPTWRGSNDALKIPCCTCFSFMMHTSLRQSWERIHTHILYFPLTRIIPARETYLDIWPQDLPRTYLGIRCIFFPRNQACMSTAPTARKHTTHQHYEHAIYTECTKH
jgi:hypothetical protein